MATYHCSVKVGGKGQASSHAAYIAREGHYAERDGYEDLEATGHGNLPSWAEGEPSRFWTAADRYERANGATYRKIEIALPRELNPAQRQELVLDFIRQKIGERHAHLWAIHNPQSGRGAGRRGGVILGKWLAASMLVSWRSAELEQLNVESAQRQARLEELDRRGGKIEFEDCDGRLYVHAAKNQGKDYKN